MRNIYDSDDRGHPALYATSGRNVLWIIIENQSFPYVEKKNLKPRSKFLIIDQYCSVRSHNTILVSITPGHGRTGAYFCVQSKLRNSQSEITRRVRLVVKNEFRHSTKCTKNKHENPVNVYRLYRISSFRRKIQFEHFILNTMFWLTNAPPCISNQTLRNDLHGKTIEGESVIFYKRFFSRLPKHNIPLISNQITLTFPNNPRRRLINRRCI